MTYGITRRGPTEYCVRHPENETPALQFTLNHSRTRDVLDSLIAAGATGCNFYGKPAPRWAAHVHKLRKMGVEIRTEYEPHGGDYPGTHARYFLNSIVTVTTQVKKNA